jgi:acetylornithine deacetylase/succinyl-diaminopimelate desuccinylase-like protein
VKLALALLLVLAPAGVLAQPAAPAEAVAIYRELIGFRTVHPEGDVTAAARAMAKRLTDAGFDPADVQVLAPAPLKGNLVARLRGSGDAKPVLVLAHIDVVDARREDWSDGLDPFTLTERDGWYYARGSIDDKAMAAIAVANLIRLKREGFRPKRDIIVALTTDEEGGTHNGVRWLVQAHRPLIDAEFALNEGAEGELIDGKPRLLGVQVSEKMYQSYELEATNAGGHSSLPRPDNAIYDLSAALSRLSAYSFPARLGPTARQFAARAAEDAAPELRAALQAIAAGKPTEADLRQSIAHPEMNAQLRTTCVATRLEGGHADNALPARAKATVNCRLLPGEEEAFVAGELARIAGPAIKVRPTNPLSATPPTSTDAPAMKAIERVAAGMWPGVEVVPRMSTGATDGATLRRIGIPVYGVTGLFVPFGENRMHGRDERLAVRSFAEGLEFNYRLLKDFAG